MTNIIAPLPRKDVLPSMMLHMMPQLAPSPGPGGPFAQSADASLSLAAKQQLPPSGLRESVRSATAQLQTVHENEEMDMDGISNSRKRMSESDEAYAEFFEIFSALSRRPAAAMAAYVNVVQAQEPTSTTATLCRRKSSVPYLFPHAGISHLEGEVVDAEVENTTGSTEAAPSFFEPPRLSKTPVPLAPAPQKQPLQVNTILRARELSNMALQKLVLEDNNEKFFDFDKVASPVSRTRNPVPLNVTFVRPVLDYEENSFVFPSLRRMQPVSNGAPTADLLGLLAPSPSPLCRTPTSAGSTNPAGVNLAAVEQFVKNRRVRSRSMSAASDRHGPFLVY
ncbi:hypothetical protein BJ742DRAFT_767944 [Cladochytrium replicatum]|nr:hypothetical protein BJ742DRAFT_767944 [Cladochytrium replicatum]